tara:strand:+ start:762 stop:998 length:237 start_codon:yes stop_codon:yes gene_type:complete
VLIKIFCLILISGTQLQQQCRQLFLANESSLLNFMIASLVEATSIDNNETEILGYWNSSADAEKNQQCIWTRIPDGPT